MFAVKFKESGGKKWFFMGKGGEGVRLKIHAILFPTKEAADTEILNNQTINSGFDMISVDLSASKFTQAQKVALARIQLGGLEALNTQSHKTGRNVVRWLIDNGYIADSGLTEKGKPFAQQFANEGII